MNKVKSIFIVLILLIISVGVVSAADVNDTSNDIPAASDVDIISDGTASYDDLYNNITNVKSNEKIVLDKNYTYQSGNKNISKVENIKNVTIEGKNNIINGNNQALALEFTNSEVTLQNLVFINCLSPVKMHNSTIKTINVTFKDCSADKEEGGAVYADSGSYYYSTNDRFIDNYASSYGASIFTYDSLTLNVNNATFSSQKHLKWGLIGAIQTFVTIINNTKFENTKSNYSTAIYTDSIISINNTKFHNLSADLTAGAIGYKGSGLGAVGIDNCEFINITSKKNGGALFIDIAGESEFDEENKGTAKISNSKFINCSSEFGGALLQLGGTLNINNTNFTNNHAEMIGGAVYTTYTNATINKANFEKNTAESNGGAIFFDMGRLTVTNSTFANNKGDLGGAITTYDASNIISDSKFVNKTADTIYTYFDTTKASITNCGDVNYTLNNKNTTIEVTPRANPIIINRQKIDGKASDPYFNLKDLNLVTSVKNQGSMGACWAFGIAGAFESAFLIATGQTIDVSENNIKNLGLRYSIFGNAKNIESGSYMDGGNYFIDWFGAINSTEDVYDELGKISPAIFIDDAYHISNVIYVDITNKNALKEALTTYGALDFYVRGALNSEKYYNPKTSSIYVNNPNAPANHYVTLVGWNDTYSRNNFATPAPGDGAWICKNSWGTEWGDGGYFYISYYDQSINRSDIQAVGFVINNDTENYDLLYQNTYNGQFGFIDKFNTYRVYFTSQGDNIIAGVGTYFNKVDTPYTLSIYINDTLVHSQSGKSKFAGFETIRLTKYIAVQPGCTFAVQINTPEIPIILTENERQHSELTSYGSFNGQFYQLEDCDVPVKVYAFNNNLTTQNIISYDNIHNTIFNVTGPENANVTISFNGKNTTVTLTNDTYTMDLGVLKVGGPYEVKINYNNQSFSNYVIIKPTIDIGSVTALTVAYKAEVNFIAGFYDLDGKPLANTKVTIISAGKNIDATTNSTGGVSFYVNSANMGSHYIDIVNPVNNYSLRVPVSIVSIFSGASNVNMYYYDGSTFKVRVKDALGRFEGAGEIVTIKIGKKTFKVKSDKNGWATLKILSSIKPGKYTIKATYYSNTVSKKLTVKQVLKTKKTVTVKKSAKKLSLSATLKAKKALKNKVVKFKVNGKTFKAKTNSKGVAKVTLKQSVIKKLKAGKKYTINVSYLYDTVKSTLKVRR